LWGHLKSVQYKSELNLLHTSHPSSRKYPHLFLLVNFSRNTPSFWAKRLNLLLKRDRR
jgi:hypothetical protein